MYHVRYLSTLLYRQIQLLSSYNSDPLHYKDDTKLAPKLADPPFGKATPPLLKLDPVNLIQIDSYFVAFRD